MMFERGRLAVIVVALAAMCGSWGCAIREQRSRQPFSHDTWDQMNTVGVSTVTYQPYSQLKSTTSGKGWGAAKGAGYGLAVGATPGLAIASTVRGCGGAREIGALVCGSILLAGLGVAAAGGTVGALVGSVHGAVTAESASRVRAAEAALEAAMADLSVQRTLRDHVLLAARERSSLRFVAMEDGGPVAVDAPDDEETPLTGDVDAVINVRVSAVRLAGHGSVNPPMTLVMTAPVTISRVADGTVLYAETFEYKGSAARKFVEWAADEGLAFREEVDRGARSLAHDIVLLLLPPAPSRDDTPIEQSTPAEQGSDEAARETRLPVSPEPGEPTHAQDLSCLAGIRIDDFTQFERDLPIDRMPTIDPLNGPLADRQ